MWLIWPWYSLVVWCQHRTCICNGCQKVTTWLKIERWQPCPCVKSFYLSAPCSGLCWYKCRLAVHQRNEGPCDSYLENIPLLSCQGRSFDKGKDSRAQDKFVWNPQKNCLEGRWRSHVKQGGFLLIMMYTLYIISRDCSFCLNLQHAF